LIVATNGVQGLRLSQFLRQGDGYLARIGRDFVVGGADILRAVWGFLTIYTFNPFLLPRSGRFFYGAVLLIAGVTPGRVIEI
jgi:hypothetical protein